MIFFSDMDGTFLDNDKAVPVACWRALDACAEAGVEFVPCTGRSAGGIPADILSHPAVRHAVSSNGAVVLELCLENPADTERARVLHETPFSREKALAIWEIAHGRDVTFDIFADGCCFARRDFWQRIPEYVDDPGIQRSMIETRTPVDEEPPETIARVRTLERVAMYWKDPADRDAILAELASVPEIDITRSYPMNIEVMEEGCSKGGSMAWLCRHLGIALADAVAFGDNLNDVSMIEMAGLGVAVANAEPEVRTAADLVCGDNDGAGAAAVIMERLGRA